MHDIVIRGGKVIDGLGGPARFADIAIDGGVITAIGEVASPARRTIDADGALVTPGFVDVHSHYDGQFLWDELMDPSFSHGVTTSIAGNCGVGVAPVHARYRSELIDFMTGVEEIPDVVLAEGLDWNWTSFADYLDRLGERHYSMDVGAHIPHGPLRVFVMGERALKHEKATAEDIAAMADLVRQAMAAGAAGFSTGRIMEHRAVDGNNVPGTFADEDEVLALAAAMGEGRHGVFQVAPRGQVGTTFRANGSAGRAERESEHELMVKAARAADRPLTYGVLDVFTDGEDADWIIEESARARAQRAQLYPQVSPRAASLMYMLDGYHLFMLRPSYRAIAHLPTAERARAMREPARRAAILGEANGDGGRIDVLVKYMTANSRGSFVLNGPLDLEPGPGQTVGVLADAAGKSIEEFLYDLYSESDGTRFHIDFVANYNGGSLESTRRFLMNANVISGLADGGAHLKVICDAAHPTCQLAYWTRDRVRGERIPLEFMVKKLTYDPAALYGLADRGSLEVGKRADINVLDYARLNLQRPEMVYDLPAGSGRLLQASNGYLATIVAGVVTRLNDQQTGARPGRLLRSAPR